MKQYTNLLRLILEKGRVKENRTGHDAISLLDAPNMVFDMDDGFPLVTERPIFFRGVVEENLWFLAGVCNNEDLLAKDVKIWDAWALKENHVVSITKDLPQLFNEYTQSRLMEMKDELSQMDPAVFVDHVQTKLIPQFEEELRAADEEDHAKDLPTLRDPKQAEGPEDMMGGFRLMRERNIELRFDHVKYPKGHLGPVYGVLWRNWQARDGEVYDQIERAIDRLRSDNPKYRYSRSILISGYDPSLQPDETLSAQENVINGKQALSPCHAFMQLIAEPLTIEERFALVDPNQPNLELVKGEHEETQLGFLDELNIPKDQLSLKMYQRSCDFPVGIPFNIAGYALLLHMFAAQCNMKPAKFIHMFGDAHIYSNQVEGVQELLRRADEEEVPALPTIRLNPDVKSIFDYTANDIKLFGYEPLKPQIKFEVAV